MGLPESGSGISDKEIYNVTKHKQNQINSHTKHEEKCPKSPRLHVDFLVSTFFLLITIELNCSGDI